MRSDYARSQSVRRWVLAGAAALVLFGAGLPARAQAPADPAQKALEDFRTSPLVGVWPNLPKGRILAQIQSRLQDPFQVNQSDTDFCGPAAIVFELVRRYPERYVRICQSLFEGGAFYGKTRLMMASETLRASERPAGIDAVDWMLLATLQETANWFFDQDKDSSGGVTGWSLKGWALEVLGCTDAWYSTTFTTGELNAFHDAGRIVEDGGVAFLHINADSLTATDGTKASPTGLNGNHFVSLMSNRKRWGDGLTNRSPWPTAVYWGLPDLDDEPGLTFDLYSWGTQKSVIGRAVHLPKYIWGVIAGRLPRRGSGIDLTGTWSTPDVPGEFILRQTATGVEGSYWVNHVVPGQIHGRWDGQRLVGDWDGVGGFAFEPRGSDTLVGGFTRADTGQLLPVTLTRRPPDLTGYWQGWSKSAGKNEWFGLTDLTTGVTGHFETASPHLSTWLGTIDARFDGVRLTGSFEAEAMAGDPVKPHKVKEKGSFHLELTGPRELDGTLEFRGFVTWPSRGTTPIVLRGPSLAR